MRLYYDKIVRARLEACRDENQPDVRFKSANEKAQLERLDDHVKYVEDERVTADSPRFDMYGDPIPVGYYVMIDSDNNARGSEPSFFESVWAPYEDFE